MFPIASERKLSIVEVAKYWSREITPSASAQELRDVISKAWWRGELIAASGSSRLSVLRGYYLRSAKFIAFAIPNTEEPSQWVVDDDGVIEFAIEVPLPNANPDTWTEANCAPAFSAVAQWWKEALISPPSAPILLDIVLTSSEFFQWVDACNYKRPTFWSPPLDRAAPLEEQDGQKGLLDSAIPRIQITKVPPKGKKSRAAWEAINSLWPHGPPENLGTATILRQVNKWISKQLRTKYPFTEVSREVVARLLRRK